MFDGWAWKGLLVFYIRVSWCSRRRLTRVLRGLRRVNGVLRRV